MAADVPTLVNTSLPSCVQAAVVPKSAVGDVVMDKLALSTVSAPVSPLKVTVDADSKSQLACSETCIVLASPDTGVLCWMDREEKVGATT